MFVVQHPPNITKTALLRANEIDEGKEKGYYVTSELKIGVADADVIKDFFNPNYYEMYLFIDNGSSKIQTKHWFTFDRKEAEQVLKDNLLRYKDYLTEELEYTELKLNEL